MTILKNTQGFTLIEALISMAVLTTGLLAIYTMQISSTKGNNSANKLIITNSTAGNGFEQLLNLPYTDPTMDPLQNHHDETELAGLTLPSGVTALSWNVTEWTNTDGIDKDGDGETDESDEVSIKSVTLIVNYRNWLAKTLTITFLKSELF